MSEDEGNTIQGPSFKQKGTESLKDSVLSGGGDQQNLPGAMKLFYIEIEIHIIDTGCGISKENLPNLFMNFSRLEEHQKMNHQGTGLGLSICKSLIELMGGSVSVDS